MSSLTDRLRGPRRSLLLPERRLIPPRSSFPLIMVPASGAVQISLTDSSADTNDASVFTFSSQALGAAASDRYIVVGAGWRRVSTSPTLTSITVGGVSCTIPAGAKLDGTVSGCALGIAAVPTGTTGDVVVTLSHSCTTSSIGVWALYNVLSDTPVGTAENTDTVTNLSVPSLSTSGGGAAIYYIVSESGSPNVHLYKPH